MKLFELKPRRDLPIEISPFLPSYDCCVGFIIRAETEEQARKIADDNSARENYKDYYKRNPVWLSSEYTTCTELSIKGKAGIIMADIHEG